MERDSDPADLNVAAEEEAVSASARRIEMLVARLTVAAVVAASIAAVLMQPPGDAEPAPGSAVRGNDLPASGSRG